MKYLHLMSFVCLGLVQILAAGEKPNFVVIFTDDQGYADLSCFGGEHVRTPRIDKMAEEGLKLTSFYAQPVCGPSRTALLSGCYPPRTAADGRGWQLKGSAVTVAEVLKQSGYATACIGKWDVSGRKDKPGMMPNDQGFDEFFGTWGANDGGEVVLRRNRERVESTRDMASLTRRYTDEAIDFIRRHREEPFFVYLAHTMAHVMIDASEPFKGRSEGDLYGDVVEEIDWYTGRILDALKDLGLERDTIVLFTCDNGPWCQREERYRKAHGGHLATGSTGPLRGHKGTSWEGGVRVPCVVWGPGCIPAGRVNPGIVSTIDLLPTLAFMGGGSLPEEKIDGVDQSALFTGKSEASARDTFLYYRGGRLEAVRKENWKLFLWRRGPGGVKQKWPVFGEGGYRLYDLENDLGEENNLADAYPDVVDRLRKIAEVACVEIGEREE